MSKPTFKQTPSQTVGPFFAYGLVPERYGHDGIADNRVAGPHAEGRAVVIRGRVLDAQGAAVPDALLEIWQADCHGEHTAQAVGGGDADGFRGFARCATDDRGRFEIHTVKPGPVAGPGNAPQAPHLSVTLFARGMLNHAFTRIYFADETAANQQDPVLGQVPQARRAGLCAVAAPDPAAATSYEIDIHLGGEQETVFFEV
ncbi:MAG: protocatechuate 3,4-dioxygenase subunit alpha [Gammaproteobacteria bacterium]|nr:protocatechuate 3,4-dioxygenase subunit alpha [Gammaproteobacteria bacterium]